MADLCWAGSYPAVKGLWLPYTHDAKIFLGILVSVISFRYMQHSSECCDIRVSSEIQSTAWSHFSTLSSLWGLRDSSQSKKIGVRSLPAISFPMPPFSEDMWYHYMVTDLACLDLMSPKNLFLCLLSFYLTTLLWGNVIADIFQINYHLNCTFLNVFSLFFLSFFCGE